MAINCKSLESISRDCSNDVGSIDTTIYINDSTEIDWDAKTVTDGEITSLDLISTGATFEVIEFRKNLATLNEDYDSDPDGAVIFEQTLVIPIHGRDASKSNKISIMASGQRLIDIILRQNGGGKYIYIREAILSNVGEGINATKKEGAKYQLTFTAESETLALYIDKDVVLGLI